MLRSMQVCTVCDNGAAITSSKSTFPGHTERHIFLQALAPSCGETISLHVQLNKVVVPAEWTLIGRYFSPCICLQNRKYPLLLAWPWWRCAHAVNNTTSTHKNTLPNKMALSPFTAPKILVHTSSWPNFNSHSTPMHNDNTTYAT